MKKGEIYEGIIEKVEFPNKGWIQTDGQKVLVKNGIPGQKVKFAVQKKRGGRIQGRILEVLEKSPLETREPVCGVFPLCGGCMYQTMSYEAQLDMKERQIRELLEPVLIQRGQTDARGNADYIWEGIHGSPKEFGYRNKMEFSFGDEIKDGVYGRGVGVGFALRGIGKQGGQRGFERGRKRPVFLLLGLRGQRREEREAETDEKAFEDG